LYPGYELSLPDEDLLDVHLKAHFAGTIDARVLVGRDDVIDIDAKIKFHNIDLGASNDLGNRWPSMPGFDIVPDAPKIEVDEKLGGKLLCEHLNCQKSFSCATDLQRHAKARNPGLEGASCPAAGYARKGAEGFTRKVKLGDHWKNKHLGTLGDLGAWMV